MMDSKITVKKKYLFINCRKRVGLIYIALVWVFLIYPFPWLHTMYFSIRLKCAFSCATLQLILRWIRRMGSFLSKLFFNIHFCENKNTVFQTYPVVTEATGSSKFKFAVLHYCVNHWIILNVPVWMKSCSYRQRLLPLSV